MNVNQARTPMAHKEVSLHWGGSYTAYEEQRLQTTLQELSKRYRAHSKSTWHEAAL